ncbi:MAG: hypothetical protein ACFFDI_03930 [Promethearchaeota archaeon]
MTNDHSWRNYHSWRPVIVAITIAGMVISTLVSGAFLGFHGFMSSIGPNALFLEVIDCTEEYEPYLNITQRDLTDFPALKTAIDEILQKNETFVIVPFQDYEEQNRTTSEFMHGYPIAYNQYCFEIGIVWVD